MTSGLRTAELPPSAEESAFLLDRVLVLDSQWECTHVSATDGYRKQVQGCMEVGRASILFDGTQVSFLGGAMEAVEDDFEQHSYEAELGAITDTGDAVRSDALARWGGGGRWMNITDCLSGTQASLRITRLADGARAACYRGGRLGGLEAVESGMEAVLQVWVNSHGAGGFAYNEVADKLAEALRSSSPTTRWRTSSAARAGQDFLPGVRVPVSHACCTIPDVKRSHLQWMLEALQVYCLEQLLSRSARTLRQSESTWDIFANDPVNHRILQSQQVYEVLTDAQAGRIAGLPGDEHPDMLDGLRSLWQPDSPRPHPPPPSATVASVFGITTSGVQYYWSGVSCLSVVSVVCLCQQFLGQTRRSTRASTFRHRTPWRPYRSTSQGVSTHNR